MALTQISPVILPLDVARKLTDAAIAEVSSIGVPYVITVIDGAGGGTPDQDHQVAVAGAAAA